MSSLNPAVSILTPSIRPQGLEIVKKCLKEQTIQDFEHLIELSDPKKGYNLSATLNRMLKKTWGEWIIMHQDWIKIEPDGIEQFLKVADEKKFITGAMGITEDWKNVKWGWRSFGKFREVEYMKWEADWAIVPRKAFFELGGYEEEYDKYWSFENVELAFRASKLGYTFWVLSSNKAIQFNHDKVEKHPFRHKYNPDFHNHRIRQIEMGQKPIKLNYLK